MDELVDAVDLNDQPTGKKLSIAEAHTTGAPHRVAAVFVFDRSKNLLLQAHELSKGLLDHTVGGHVASSENYQDAAMREMKEEIGMVAPLRLVKQGVISNEHATGRNVIHIFGVFETLAEIGWKFMPNTEVKNLVPMSLDKIFTAMNNDPNRFTLGFINTLNVYVLANKLPIEFDVEKIRKNWSEL